MKLTQEQLDAVKQIKSLITKSAKDIIEIGKLIAETKLVKGQKELFYKELGMSTRTGQRYQKIYNSPKVQALVYKDELDGLNFTNLMELSQDEDKPANNVKHDFTKIATNMSKRYSQDEINTLIGELTKLLSKTA